MTRPPPTWMRYNKASADLKGRDIGETVLPLKISTTDFSFPMSDTGGQIETSCEKWMNQFWNTTVVWFKKAGKRSCGRHTKGWSWGNTKAENKKCSTTVRMMDACVLSWCSTRSYRSRCFLDVEFGDQKINSLPRETAFPQAYDKQSWWWFSFFVQRASGRQCEPHTRPRVTAGALDFPLPVSRFALACLKRRLAEKNGDHRALRALKVREARVEMRRVRKNLFIQAVSDATDFTKVLSAPCILCLVSCALWPTGTIFVLYSAPCSLCPVALAFWPVFNTFAVVWGKVKRFSLFSFFYVSIKASRMPVVSTE